MSVEKVFWTDPYLTCLTAKVTTVEENKITLDRTIAYAFSGGQASDSGWINGQEICKAEKIDQEIFYTLQGPQSLKVGDLVTIELDWEKRYRIMKLHFAAEIILELVNQNFAKPEKIGANISDTKARVDFMWDGNISETFDLLRTEAERLINNDKPIISEFADRDNEVRYWEIEGFAKVFCGGTHPRTTGEIGKIKLKRDNIGKGKERIEISLLEN